jgi:ornithine cyclodeaminase/alanine dehydrogenase-like protein (mu-crystallin family)
MPARSPLYLSAPAIKSCLTDGEIYDVVGETLRALAAHRAIKGPKSGFGVEIDGDRLHMGSVSGCVLSNSVAGIKWFTVSDRNASLKLPRVPATILVCDAATGLLDGVLDGTHLTSDRTAAMAIVAAMACGTHPLKNAAVVGAGATGRALAKFLVATQPIQRITVASRNESSARRACEDIPASFQGNAMLDATTDVQRATRDADVVFTATGVREDTDVVRAAWLRDDAIVCSLGSCREVDLEIVSQAWIVVDDIEGVRLRRSDFSEGGAGRDRIAGDIGGVMSGALQLPRFGAGRTWSWLDLAFSTLRWARGRSGTRGAGGLALRSRLAAFDSLPALMGGFLSPRMAEWTSSASGTL